MKFDATQLSAFEAAALDILVKVLVFAILLVLNVVSKALTTLSLPDPAITLPLATLLVSQFDSYFIDYAKKENVPVPQQ